MTIGRAATRGRLRSAILDAARDAKRAWSVRSTAWVVAFAAAAAVPAVVSSPVSLSRVASGLYVALAAIGLNFAVGFGGMPSLGQGAFAGAGAFTTAWLRVHAAWEPAPA